MYLFDITRYDKTYHVYKTKHTKDSRKASKVSRDHHYTDEKLKEILYNAVGSLSQFRNKGATAISFRNENGKTNALLVDLEGDKLTIITMLHNTDRRVNDVFYANSVYLKDYIFKIPTRLEKSIDKFDNADLMIKEVSAPKPKKIRKVKKSKQRNKQVKVAQITQEEIDEFLQLMKS